MRFRGPPAALGLRFFRRLRLPSVASVRGCSKQSLRSIAQNLIEMSLRCNHLAVDRLRGHPRATSTVNPLRRLAILAAAFACLLIEDSPVSAAPVNKCVVNGTVTYQSDPCPTGQPRKVPTIQELNAQEKTLRSEATARRNADGATPLPSPATGHGVDSSTQRDASAAPVDAPTPSSPANFHCDGRRRCGQMKSCAEAKYFLAHCPGVEMDGDRDGIPCERQWCDR